MKQAVKDWCVLTTLPSSQTARVGGKMEEGVMPLCKQGKPMSLTRCLTDRFHAHVSALVWSCLTNLPCAVARLSFRSDEPPQFTLTVYLQKKLL